MIHATLYKSKNDNFTYAISVLLRNDVEGKYSNNPNDAGGETNFGLSKRSYPDLDIKNLTQEKANSIYEKDFWLKFRLNEIDDSIISMIILLSIVNMGPKKAIISVQLALRKLKNCLDIDGIMGDKTINAINKKDVDPLVKADLIRINLVKTYLSIANSNKNSNIFLKGWLNRIFKE